MNTKLNIICLQATSTWATWQIWINACRYIEEHFPKKCWYTLDLQNATSLFIWYSMHGFSHMQLKDQKKNLSF